MLVCKQVPHQQSRIAINSTLLHKSQVHKSSMFYKVIILQCIFGGTNVADFYHSR